MAKLTMVEFPGDAAAHSAKFFEDVFSWSSTAYGPEYLDVQIGGNQTLGFQQDRSEAPGAPLVVFEVEDLVAMRTAIEQAGGVVTVEPFDFPGGTRLHFREPSGNELAVWTPITG
ncbi:MAG: VOC family protein [Tomitella sp.]|nr:VOC family protein [Tomitella sp.]